MYECHITLYLGDGVVGSQVAKRLHWKTSQISRDPVLGDDTYFYLTTHASDYPAMRGRMDEALEELRGLQVHIVREKIECIVHDVRHPNPS